MPSARRAGSRQQLSPGINVPRVDSSNSRFSSDPLGRIAPWFRIHLIDPPVFLSVPATAFTLTATANAPCIAGSIVTELD